MTPSWAKLGRQCTPVLLLVAALLGTILLADTLAAQPWAQHAFSSDSRRGERPDPARPLAAEFLATQCHHLKHEHNDLVAHYLRPWLQKKVQEGDLSRWPGHLYLNASGAYANEGLEIGRLMPTYLRTLEVASAAVAWIGTARPLHARAHVGCFAMLPPV